MMSAIVLKLNLYTVYEFLNVSCYIKLNYGKLLLSSYQVAKERVELYYSASSQEI